MPFHPFNVQDECGIMWGILSSAGGVNAYDGKHSITVIDDIVSSHNHLITNHSFKW